MKACPAPSCAAWRHVLNLVLAVALLPTCASAQVSTIGTDFWGCDMENTEGGTTEPFGILVANAGATAAFVTVEGATGILARATVAPNDLATMTFDRSRMMLGTSLAPAAYHVMATQPVTVFQFNPLSTMNVATNDASTVLPVPSLGTTYRPLSREEVSFGGLIDLPGTIAIVGLSVAPTTVTFTPNGAVRAGFVPATAAGTPIVFTLNRFDVAQFMTDVTSGADFTGSLISSDRPIAVFGGSRCSFVPSRTQACDHLEEQMFPVTAWGRDILAIKSPPRGPEPDVFRVVASEDATTVTLTPDPIGAPVTLQAGEYVEFSTVDDTHVVANKPIEVGQYLVGQAYDPSITVGDPSLILAIPTEQFDDNYIFLTPATYFPDYVIIVKPDSASVDLDGVTVPAASFRGIGSTGYSRAQIPVDDGVHRVNATAGVGVYVIGYTTFASYGYYAGAKSVDINSPITCDAGGPYSVGCAGGVVTLDGSGSSGPGPLTYLWSALTPGLVIATPNAAITSATTSGAGPWSVSLTLGDGINSSTCVVTVDSGADLQPPLLTCVPQMDAVPSDPGSAMVIVTASATDDCDPSPVISNDRTAGGADASDRYPCGETLVTFTATDAAGHVVTCVTRVVVASLAAPAGLSEGAPAAWMRVAKVSADPSVLDITLEMPTDFSDLVNLYAGTILPTGIVAYDHAPVSCHVLPMDLGGGVGLMRAPFDAGQSHYYLVSSSNCLAEGTRGSRSDGLARQALPTDCGPLP